MSILQQYEVDPRKTVKHYGEAPTVQKFVVFVPDMAKWIIKNNKSFNCYFSRSNSIHCSF